MILIQIILIVAFTILLVRFLLNPHGSRMEAWKKIIGLFFIVGAIGAVLLPEFLNTIAHAVGVGRGADLLLYILTLAFIFVCINLYIYDDRQQRRMVELARKMAITEANQRYAKHKA